jgi:hypothetical protein
LIASRIDRDAVVAVSSGCHDYAAQTMGIVDGILVGLGKSSSAPGAINDIRTIFRSVNNGIIASEHARTARIAAGKGHQTEVPAKTADSQGIIGNGSHIPLTTVPCAPASYG